MSNYKFSVLMSVYDKENPEHFDLSLKSNLVDQTLIPDEMVLICDGPLTDELNNVISRYHNRFPDILKIYRLDHNVGLGNALNYGLNYCSYEWIARSDSDDICVRERFEIQFSFLKQHRDIDILSSYIDEFEEDCNKPSRRKIMPLDHNGIVKMAKTRTPLCHAAVIFRKSVVIAAGSYQDLPFVEDYYLWVRAICNGARLACIDKYLVHVRIGNGMLNRRSDRLSINSWKILNQYMLKQKMIGKFKYCINMISIRIFTYMGVNLKKFIYKYLLRS